MKHNSGELTTTLQRLAAWRSRSGMLVDWQLRSKESVERADRTRALMHAVRPRNPPRMVMMHLAMHRAA